MEEMVNSGAALTGTALAFLGMACAVFFGGTGSAIGLSLAGRAGNGVLTDKPERYGTQMLLVVLPSSQGIYGLVAALLTLKNMNAFTQGAQIFELSMTQGWIVLAGGLAVGISCLFSGIFQGKVCAAGILMAAKRPEMATKAGVMYGIFVELYALFGFLAWFLIVNNGIDWASFAG
ncbi:MULTISPECIES: V-type ATP synthase subunit K [Sedimentisphaera]|uniref:Sodium ATPase proteolipid component n=2 Tax=Sedimentisphaera TaxID=2483368 RepID=A0A1W6LK10_9BACT|nr:MULTISPECIES: V-type ATP synthase subunit K [Sedimentisphaera]AQQ08681.1 Sodium ATPase proteolipid component [Sedimentisphaera cyanobacteriorum]ARN56121.1 Sodium ATPase proteolipid component [Sedimentisphaera salicampi]OXU15753.1 Sodium ATPase proteolipid component [Sedimentisphaera salicampi]